MDINKITCAGFILCNPNNNKIVLVETPKSHFSYPKGKYEKKKDGLRCFDSLFKCALRELCEETQFIDYTIKTINSDDEEQIFIDNNILYYPAVVTNFNENSFKCDNIPNDEIQSVKWYDFEEITNIEPYFFKTSRKNIALQFLNKLKNNELTLENEVYIPNIKLVPDIKNNSNIKNNNSNVTDNLNNEHIYKKKAVLNGGEKREKFISKKLSYFLRHHLDRIPGGADSEGFASVESLLSMDDFKGITKEEIETVTINNEKQRFKIIGSKIRANQGHSIESGKMLDSTKLLNKITEPYDYCVHGTVKKYIKSIVENGLNKANRTHIHFASKPNATSGFRNTSNVFIHVDMNKAMENGIDFYISDNGVILSEGPISSEYFSKIEYM